jgi:hypothetical protein
MKEGDRTLFSPARAGVFIEACRLLSIMAETKEHDHMIKIYGAKRKKAVKTSQKPSCKTKGIDVQNH